MGETTLSKIAISSTADEALSKSVEIVNQGFEGGRVTKTDLANWIILRITTDLDDATIKKVRMAHFNQLAYLENLVRRMKATDQEQVAPEDLKPFHAILLNNQKKQEPRSRAGSQRTKDKSDQPNS